MLRFIRYRSTQSPSKAGIYVRVEFREREIYIYLNEVKPHEYRIAVFNSITCTPYTCIHSYHTIHKCITSPLSSVISSKCTYINSRDRPSLTRTLKVAGRATAQKKERGKDYASVQKNVYHIVPHHTGAHPGVRTQFQTQTRQVESSAMMRHGWASQSQPHYPSLDYPPDQPSHQERDHKKAFSELPSKSRIKSRDIRAARPLRTAHNFRRAVALFGPRAAEQGRRGAAVLAEVEVDVDVCKQKRYKYEYKHK